MTGSRHLVIDIGDDASAIRIAGTKDAFMDAIACLQSLSAHDEDPTDVPLGADGAGATAVGVEFRFDAQGVELVARDGGLVIRAGAAGISWLAATAERFVRGEIPGGATHLHLEHFDGHPFLTESSTPAVLELIPDRPTL